jgi:hypothetical protein
MPSTITKRLYALLVAINDYCAPVPPLRGCVNDIQKVAAYLKDEAQDFDLRVSQLLNSEATKENIVHAFTTHFQPAGSNDVALFYFSGHGTQEEANSIFWPVEEDRKLESIVCYDSYTVSQGQAIFRLLADKEIRYMISKIASRGAHILTIFDCCHSGGNTRNGFIGKMGEDIRERRVIFRERLSQAFPEREWKDFIFSDSVSLEDARINSIHQYLPEGRHIHMAACQNDESAFEVEGEGVFTKTLLEILMRSEGSVTYFDLQGRIQNYLRNQFRQTPKTYVVGEDESSLFLGFLNKKKETKPLYGNVTYNTSGGWMIDFGSMHGLTGESTIKIEAHKPSTFFIASVKELFSNHALLELDKPDLGAMNPLLSYKGYTTDYFATKLNIFVHAQQSTTRQALVNSISSSLGNCLTFVENEIEADYSIKESNGNIFISKRENLTVPIVPPLATTAVNLTTIIPNYLQHLCQYEFVRSLQNPNAFLFNTNPIDISFLQNKNKQSEESIAIVGDEVRPDFSNQADRRPGGSIRIKLKNKSDRKIYCALVYLTFNFGIIVKMLRDVVVGLEPNAEVWALDGSEIGLTLEEEVVKYNYKESVSTLKLIVSTSDFKQQAVRFELPPLPSPLSSGSKGLNVLDLQYNPGQIDDWHTRNYHIKIKNPNFKP